MLLKSVIVTFGFLGLLVAGTVAGTAPASAGYSCGPWNAWCGRAFWYHPGWADRWYGHRRRHHDRDDWRRFYSHKDGNNDWHKGNRRRWN